MNKQRNTPTSRNVAATESNRAFFGDAPVSSSESLSLDEPSPFYLMWKKLENISISEQIEHKERKYRKSLNFIEIESISIDF